MRQVACVLVWMSSLPEGVGAEEPTVAGDVSTERAKAIQFGIFFGGIACQYDLCVRKGFLRKNNPSEANWVLDKMQEFNHFTDQRSFMQQGWETMKQWIAQHDADYTQEKCSWVAREWKKMKSTMRVK